MVSKKFADDGVTQKVEVKTGVVTKELQECPNPVSLAPYRTFTEVEQPASSFVLRAQQSKIQTGGVDFALFEADGGHWKIKAINLITEYFTIELKEQLESGRVIIL